MFLLTIIPLVSISKGLNMTRQAIKVLRDTDHVTDRDGNWWCYCKYTDVFTLRNKKGRHGMCEPMSARSFRQLKKEFGPLKRMKRYDDEDILKSDWIKL